MQRGPPPCSRPVITIPLPSASAMLSSHFDVVDVEPTKPAQPWVVVWSNRFHQAGFELSTADEKEPRIIHRFRFGSNVSVLRRLMMTLAITYLVVARRARVCIPDSDCTISRYLARLQLLLGKNDDLILVPDGFITSKPLSLSRCESDLSRPITREAVLDLSQAWSSSCQAAQQRLKVSVIIALKRPQGMNEANALSLARMMLSMATYNSESITIGVSCHRTIPRASVQKLFKELNAAATDSDISIIRYQLVEFHCLDLESITVLHSLPSTVIWQVWHSNPSARVHLYDPTKLGMLSQGQWRADLTESIRRTKQQAERQNHRLMEMITKTNGLAIEVWQ